MHHYPTKPASRASPFGVSLGHTGYIGDPGGKYAAPYRNRRSLGAPVRKAEEVPGEKEILSVWSLVK